VGEGLNGRGRNARRNLGGNSVGVLVDTVESVGFSEG